MSPIEDEAVVATLLRENEGLELVDTRMDGSGDLLPGLLRRNGVSTWRVAEENESATKDQAKDTANMPVSGRSEVKSIRWLSSPGEAKHRAKDHYTLHVSTESGKASK